jgi:hypothetical protein
MLGNTRTLIRLSYNTFYLKSSVHLRKKICQLYLIIIGTFFHYVKIKLSIISYHYQYIFHYVKIKLSIISYDYQYIFHYMKIKLPNIILVFPNPHWKMAIRILSMTQAYLLNNSKITLLVSNAPWQTATTPNRTIQALQNGAGFEFSTFYWSGKLRL